MTNFIIAFTTTLLAGLSTGIGGIFSIILKRNNNFLCFCLGLSVGAMICLSIIEIIPESILYLSKYTTPNNWIMLIIFGFILGTVIVMLTNKLLMSGKNSLYKTGIITMIAVALHNLPEGIIVFMTSTKNIKLGMVIAIAIAIHNIPEGIAIATPIYHSTHNKWKSFYMAISSGFVEIMGGILCYILLSPFISNFTIGLMLSIVAGIMVYISLYNLLPESYRHGNKKYSYLGILCGTLIIIIAQILLK